MIRLFSTATITTTTTIIIIIMIILLLYNNNNISTICSFSPCYYVIIEYKKWCTTIYFGWVEVVNLKDWLNLILLWTMGNGHLGRNFA